MTNDQVENLVAAERSPRSLEQSLAHEHEVLGTRDFARRAGRGSAVLGLSGGIDAAVTAVLATRALEPENVLAVAMPAPGSSEAELRDAEELAIGDCQRQNEPEEQDDREEAEGKASAGAELVAPGAVHE